MHAMYRKQIERASGLRRVSTAAEKLRGTFPLLLSSREGVRTCYPMGGGAINPHFVRV